MHVLVKGCGVAGLTVAHELAERGIEVTVRDLAPRPGGGASWMAGGMLAPYCERESAEEAVVSLGKDAANWWKKTLPGTVTKAGTLLVAPARDTSEITRFASRTRGYAKVDAGEIGALEPHLAGRFRSGLFFAEEAHLDPRAALLRLHDKLAAAGVAFDFGDDAQDRTVRYGATVDCTGMAAATALEKLRGVRGEMAYLETHEIELNRPVRLVHPRFPIYVVPRGDGRFMVGATMIESADTGPVTARSLMELLNAAYALHPAFGEARVIETASGVRPAFPDNLPRVEKQGDTLFVNGLYRHGFLLAPAMARQVADTLIPQKEHDRADHTERQTA